MLRMGANSGGAAFDTRDLLLNALYALVDAIQGRDMDRIVGDSLTGVPDAGSATIYAVRRSANQPKQQRHHQADHKAND